MKSRHPSWFSEGIAFTGNWEPLFMRRRAGRARHNEGELYLEEHSEATVKQLAEAGINLIIAHFTKGGAAEEEAEEVEMTRLLARRCHQHGIKLGTYIRYDTLYPDLLGDRPEAQKWERRMWDGSRPTYSRQSFRKLACPTCEEHLRFVEEKVKLAIQFVEADLIHFDGFEVGKEPASCQCRRCREAFHRFLVEKYGSDQDRIKERFGHTHLDRIDPPQFHPVTAPFVPTAPVPQPAAQEWAAFRWSLTAGIHRRLSNLIRSLNPEAAVEMNGGFSIHRNTYVSHGCDITAFASDNHAMWTEDPHWPGIRNGVLVSRIRQFKCAQGLGNVAFSYIRGDTERQLRLSFAQALAFNNGSLGHVGSGLPAREPYWPVIQKWLRFFRSKANLFQSTVGLARVAVLRHRASLAFGGLEAYRGAGVAEQILIQSHIPFDILFDRHMPEQIDNYAAIILPNTVCLSDEEADQFQRYVSEGAGLVVTERSGYFDEVRREREDTVLRPLLGDRAHPTWTDQNEGLFGGNRRILTPEQKLETIQKEFGNGRIAYLPGETYQDQGPHIWSLPADWRDLEKTVRWAANGPMPLLTDAPPTVVCEPRATRDRHRVVHLVNYDLTHPANNMTLDVEIPESRTVRGVSLHAPETDAPQKLPYELRGGRCQIPISDLDIYALVEIEIGERTDDQVQL